MSASSASPTSPCGRRVRAAPGRQERRGSPGQGQRLRACWVHEFDRAAPSSVEPTAESNRCHRAATGGPRDGLERKPPGDRARNAGAPQACRRQTSRQDEGDRGWSVTRAPAARWWSTSNPDPEGPMRPGDGGLFPSGLRMITDGISSGRSPVAAALFDERKSVCCLRGRWPRARLVPSPILLGGDGCTGRQDGEGLGPQELSPRRSDPPRRRPQTMAAQHVRDRRGGDPDAELEQLPADPHVAPPGVLPAKAKDQIAQLGIDPRTSRPPAPPRSLLALELAAPALQRVGDNREAGPPLLREEPAYGGEEGSVGGAVAGPLPPPPGEDPQLMPQHGDLQFPIIDARADE